MRTVSYTHLLHRRGHARCFRTDPGDDERVGLWHRLHHLGGDLAHCLTAVSYTHLDVYKRQIIIRAGDMVIDGSVRGRLERLADVLQS